MKHVSTGSEPEIGLAIIYHDTKRASRYTALPTLVRTHMLHAAASSAPSGGSLSFARLNAVKAAVAKLNGYV